MRVINKLKSKRFKELGKDGGEIWSTEETKLSAGAVYPFERDGDTVNLRGGEIRVKGEEIIEESADLGKAYIGSMSILPYKNGLIFVSGPSRSRRLEDK